MKYLDLTLPTPAENLACDEALLDAAEAGEGDEVLRFWEPHEHFVVVGYANKVATEVNVAACEIGVGLKRWGEATDEPPISGGARTVFGSRVRSPHRLDSDDSSPRKVPILRRCSGGGTVLQGPGCLSYALVLRIAEDGPLRSISTANRFIMGRNRAAIEALLSRRSRRKEAHSFKSEIQNRESEIAVCGHTDLAISGLKFSGNSQRRRRHFLLFHGSFLLNLDLALVSELLPMPSKQPDYRKSREHSEFLMNLNVSADAVKAALRNGWRATEGFSQLPANEIATLVEQKYSTDAWNFRM